MKIYINGRFLTQRFSGVQRYAWEMTKAIDLLINTYDAFEKNQYFVIAPTGCLFEPKLKNIQFICKGISKGHLWEQFELPIYTRDGFLITRTANGVDYFIANSKFIAKRIKKVYGREAKVIYSPVDIDAFEYCAEKEDYYLTASQLVPNKKVKLIVEAFNKMPDKKLIVIGDGPDFAKTKAIA